MSKKSMKFKALRKAKFSSRQNNRCPLCGRPRAFMRKFQMCRLCFRKAANQGVLPGVTKASW